MKMHTHHTLSFIAIVAILSAALASNVQAAVSGFVTRTGNQLILNGSPFRFSGSNMYWVGLDENDGGIGFAAVAYPTNFRVDDAMATAVEMGETVVRCHTLGDSVGSSLTLSPTLGAFNSTAFQYMDYAVYSAGNHGIRLQIPLVDDYNYYSGGKLTWCNWISDSNYDDFYTNSTIIADFEQYISTILNHVNQYTGVAYKNDPTIAIWETGNELSLNNGSLPPTSWTQTISNYIKSIDSNHLVMDGSHGVNAGSLTLSNVDCYTNHYYPLNATQLTTDANTVGEANKVFITGEYAWSNGDLNGFLNTALDNSYVSGDMFWSLFGHLDYWGFEQHNDGYTVHYPGDTSTMQTDVQLLRTHAYAMRGISSLPAPGTPQTPLITGVDVNGNVAWRGAALAATYQLERSTSSSSGPWTVATSGTVTDNTTPYADTSHPGGEVWYRVQGANLSGVYGPFSAAYAQVLSGGSTSQLVDPCTSFSNVYAKSANWSLDTTNSAYFNGDTSRANRSVDDTEYLTYKESNIGGVTIQCWDDAFDVYSLTLSASPDNVNWTSIPTAVSGFALGDGGTGNWSYYNVSNASPLPTGMSYLKITVSGGPVAYSPELGQVTIEYGTWQASAPASPTGLTAAPGNAQVSLAWTASSGATSYNVYRGTSSGGEGATAIASGITSTSYLNSGLANGTTYYYEVAAVNSLGTSGMSNQASATPLAVPAAPTGLSASAGNAQVSLTWTASSGATSYNIYRGTTAGGESSTAVATGITSASYVNTGLANGTHYYFEVAAVNSTGVSAQSNEASATPEPAAPATPTGLVATPGNTQVTLSWTASSGATSYNVYRSTTSGGEGTTAYATGITSTNFTNSGLVNGTTYYYKVAAVNGGGTSAQSSQASAAPIASTYVQFVNRNTGTAITTDGGFQVATYVAGDTGQQWTLSPTGDGYYYLINHGTGTAITTDGGFQCVAYESGYWGQEWTLSPTGDGYYYLINRNTGAAITTDGGFQCVEYESGYWGQEWAER